MCIIVQALAARYAGTHGRVDYRAMLAELESVFTTSGMERDPASTTSDFTSSLRRPENQMPPHMEHACDELIQRLARTVRTRRPRVSWCSGAGFEPRSEPQAEDRGCGGRCESARRGSTDRVEGASRRRHFQPEPNPPTPSPRCDR